MPQSSAETMRARPVLVWHPPSAKEYNAVRMEALRAIHGERDGKGVEEGEADRWMKWALEQADRADPLSPSPYSVLDEPEPMV